MAAYDYDLIVLGAGPSGATAAIRGRELGARVAVIERARAGGVCTNTGCVPTRVLAKTSRMLRDIRDARNYGIHIDPPQLVWPETLARVREVIENIHHAKRLQTTIEEAGVDYLHGAATFTDPHTITLDGERTLTADKYILCCGGHPARVPIPGAELALTSDDIWTLAALPRSAVIIGTGATGVQLASVFETFGITLTLLDVAPHILPAEDIDVANVLAETFAARGVEVITGIDGIDRIEALPKDVRRVSYHKGGAALTIEAEAVLICTGWAGNIEGLGLEAAGVALDRRYVKVDDALQTSAPNIYAAGDITGRMMLVQAADYEAHVAAENAVRGSQLRASHLVVPHGSFTDPEIAGVGLTEAEARRQFPDCLIAVAHYRHLERALIDNHPIGLLKLIVDRASRKLLGAHAAGEQAVGTIQAVAVGLGADITVDALAALELAYPTYAEIIVSAARQLAPAIGHVETKSLWKHR